MRRNLYRLFWGALLIYAELLALANPSCMSAQSECEESGGIYLVNRGMKECIMREDLKSI